MKQIFTSIKVGKIFKHFINIFEQKELKREVVD